MKHRLRTAVSAALALQTIASPAFAQTVEPSTGFVRGPQPEWQQAHVESERSSAEHRDYHRLSEQFLLQWLRDNTSDMIGYSRMSRDMHQLRNLDHRMFHDPTYTPESTEPQGTIRAPVIPETGTESITPAFLLPVFPSTPGVERRYDGEKPSRRTIRALAEMQFQR